MNSTNAIKGSESLLTTKLNKQGQIILTVEKVKELRVKHDSIMLAQKELSSEQRSRELSSSYTSLQLSRMWAGKVLSLDKKEKGYEKDGKRKDKKDIEAPLDVANKGFIYPKDKDNNRTQKIDTLRQVLKRDQKDLEEFLEYRIGGQAKRNLQISLMHLEEAIMWLGAELGRIYKTQENKK